jgi:hypothetical protein
MQRSGLRRGFPKADGRFGVKPHGRSAADVRFFIRIPMKAPRDITQPRLILFVTGLVSVLLALWHFYNRGDIIADATTRAAHDLNGLSMLFAGLVTLAVAWMAVSAQLTAAYGALYGVYNAAYAWILLFSGISWTRATMTAVLAVAALFAASNAWATRDGDKNL